LGQPAFVINPRLTPLLCLIMLVVGCSDEDGGPKVTACQQMASTIRLAETGVNGDDWRPHVIDLLDRTDLSERMGNAGVQVVIAIDRHEESVSEESIAAYQGYLAAYDAECPPR